MEESNLSEKSRVLCGFFGRITRRNRNRRHQEDASDISARRGCIISPTLRVHCWGKIRSREFDICRQNISRSSGSTSKSRVLVFWSVGLIQSCLTDLVYGLLQRFQFASCEHPMQRDIVCKKKEARHEVQAWAGTNGVACANLALMERQNSYAFFVVVAHMEDWRRIVSNAARARMASWPDVAQSVAPVRTAA